MRGGEPTVGRSERRTPLSRTPPRLAGSVSRPAHPAPSLTSLSDVAGSVRTEPLRGRRTPGPIEPSGSGRAFRLKGRAARPRGGAVRRDRRIDRVPAGAAAAVIQPAPERSTSPRAQGPRRDHRSRAAAWLILPDARCRPTVERSGRWTAGTLPPMPPRVCLSPRTSRDVRRRLRLTA